MSKQTGSYESLIRGVSEQVPHDRFVGQHWLQSNFVSDPVRGLARRRGSVMVSEKIVPVSIGPETLADLKTYKEFTFNINSVEYSLMYRPGQKVSGSTMSGVVCINKDTGVIMDVVAHASDAATVTAHLDSGINAVGNIAKYLLLAPKNRGPDLFTQNTVEQTKNSSVIWVKQGAYARTYSAKITRSTGAVVTVSYTTPTSYYQGVLDTTDIATSDPDYQKKVNDRVYAYQTAVNQWIGTSAAAIQPQNIAAQLLAQMSAAGMVAIARQGSTVVTFDAQNVEVDDGGDGSFMKGVAQEVQSANDLSPIHSGGKTVRIRPKGSGGDSAGVYYVKASRKDLSGSLDFGEVIWTEAPGILQTPTFLTLLGEIIGNTLYLATTQALLQAVSGDTNQTPYAPSAAGDLDSQPIPTIFGKVVDHITTFQDRLVLIAGSTVVMSKSGDYFNFFRASALTLASDDPIEVFALGSQGDTISASVLMDRSVLLFGKQQQYALDGRQAMTPTNAYVATQSAIEDTTTCPPVGSGNYIFFSQQRDERLTIQQMQTGDYADSFRAFEITTQLDGYLKGTPRQIVALTSPSALFIRTQEFTNGFYTFQYLDKADQTERLFDAWSHWAFSPTLGPLVGITGHNGNILALTLRASDHGAYLVLDRFSRSADLDNKPYLDSMRIWTNTTGSITKDGAFASAGAVAADKTAGQYFLLGQPLANWATLSAAIGTTLMNSSTWMGALFDSEVEPTAPYMRDKKDKAILDGTLTLTTYNITLAKSAAMRGYLRGTDQDVSQEMEVLDWIYRPAGSWVLNTQQVASTYTVPVDVQQEVREFKLRLTSRNWLPLTLSSIEWSGQFFTQRTS
ncbi:tail protein [Pseudomonas phage vB_PpuP-Pori-2]